MSKPLLLFLYGVALYFVVSSWYKRGNTGIPQPQVLAAPTYLYGLLDIASGFTGNFTVPVALGLTFALAYRATSPTPAVSGASAQHSQGSYPEGGPSRVSKAGSLPTPR